MANATAAIKLVAESFRDLAEKSRSRRFWYGYHKDAHTSLVGVREYSHGQHYCFESNAEVDAWIDSPASYLVNRPDPTGLGLFAYPGQSNMSGKRLPLSWLDRMRSSDTLHNTCERFSRGISTWALADQSNIDTLFDAAALAMTSPMEPVFQDPDRAPDFTCLSLYKIFGFPDLGALVVRRQSGHILTLRKYFGGGKQIRLTLWFTSMLTLGQEPLQW